MNRPTYEDRQKRRYQPISDNGNRFAALMRSKREDDYLKREPMDSDRALRRDRTNRDESSEQPWNPGDDDHVNARPVSYQDLGSQSSSNKNRDSDSYRDDRNSGPHSAWDDRSPSTQRSGTSYPTSSYGSRFSGEQPLPPNRNANQTSYENASLASNGRADQGNFGSYGSGETFGSNGHQGSRQWQGQGSQSYSPTHYGTQHSGLDFGQHYGTGQQLYGNDTFASNKSGRGPKGYTRSDERIREDVCELLTSHPEIDPSEVDIQVSSSEITLTGTVDNRHEKRLIEDIASSVSGVSEVNNQLRVNAVKGSVRSQKAVSENYMSTRRPDQESSDQSDQTSRST